MLLNSDDRAPVKAIDFGLAVPYDPEQLPRTDLGLEGTPWYVTCRVFCSSKFQTVFLNAVTSLHTSMLVKG